MIYLYVNAHSLCLSTQTYTLVYNKSKFPLGSVVITYVPMLILSLRQ